METGACMDIGLGRSKQNNCSRCGDPLPLDGLCDCEGTDIDRLTQLAELKHTNVVTTKVGWKRDS